MMNGESLGHRRSACHIRIRLSPNPTVPDSGSPPLATSLRRRARRNTGATHLRHGLEQSRSQRFSRSIMAPMYLLAAVGALNLAVQALPSGWSAGRHYVMAAYGLVGAVLLVWGGCAALVGRTNKILLCAAVLVVRCRRAGHSDPPLLFDCLLGCRRNHHWAGASRIESPVLRRPRRLGDRAASRFLAVADTIQPCRHDLAARTTRAVMRPRPRGTAGWLLRPRNQHGETSHLVHKSAPAARQTRRSQPYNVAEPITVIKVR